jgi:hypothetical protein
MKKIFFLTAPLFVFVGFVLQACNHYDEIMKNGKESSVNEKSHNAGRGCMSCHHDNGNEASEKWWYVAGTVYSGGSPAANSGFIELWTDSNRTGEMLYRVPVDRAGNFYTAKIFNFKGGFFPVYVSNSNTFKAMQSKTTDGSCNNSGCHGGSQGYIDIN